MCVPLHNVEKAHQGLVNGKVEQSVFNHLPFANLLDKLIDCAAEKKMSACHCEGAVHKRAEMRAARCLSTRPARIMKHSFIITLSVYRSRIAYLQVLWCELTGLPFCGLQNMLMTISLDYFHSAKCIGMLGGGTGACSTCCRVLQEVCFFHKCSRSVVGATCYCFGSSARRCHSLTFYSDTNRFSDIARECSSCLFSALVYYSRAFFNWASSLQPSVSPLGFPVLKTNALVVRTVK